MDNIHQLDENEIRQYKGLHSTGEIGDQVNSALKDYRARMISISCNDFYNDDTSSAKKALTELNSQMETIVDIMTDVDFMIDNLIHMMQAGILDEEENRARSLPED